MPPALRDWITAHPTAQTAAAVVLRIAERSSVDPVVTRCAALARAFAGWSSKEATALLATLPDATRAALRPDLEVLAGALVHPEQRDAFRQARAALDALPPSAALPALYALDTLADAHHGSDQRRAGEGLAWALYDHRRLFTDIARALRDDGCAALLPQIGDPSVQSALWNVAVDTPLIDHRLAAALHDIGPVATLDALTAMAPDRIIHIQRFLLNAIRDAIVGDRDALITAVAAPGHADAPAQTLRAWIADDPLPLLAMRLLIDDNPDGPAGRGNAGAASRRGDGAAAAPARELARVARVGSRHRA